MSANNSKLDRENHARIQYLLALAGTTFSGVADRLSISPSAVCSASLGRYRSARVEQEISRIVGLPVSEIWPGRTPSKKQEDAA
ncbi:helix-turn-helix domain-containing protein [Litoreibacter roseus]|uniref:helix-turn-helix domain-containing protein n=1 Tax=Litoreibacter roseus TaxID=2601869 RepID=UPI0035712292